MSYRATVSAGDRGKRRNVVPPPAAGRSRLLQRFEAVCQLPKTAVIDDRGELSFLELDELSEAWAGQLKGRVVSGSRVGVLMTPGCNWVAAFWAVLRAGCCVVPLSPAYPPAELVVLASRAQVRVVLCEDEATASALGAATAAEAVTLAPNLSSLVLRVEREPQHDAASFATPRLPPLRAQEPGPAGAEAQHALLLFTSGTTGRPKLVPLSCAQVYTGVAVLAEHWGMSAGDVLLHTLPLHHLHGICVALLQALLSGATTRFCEFEPERVLHECPQSSVLMAVPTHYYRLLRYVESLAAAGRQQASEALSSLRLLTSGSAKLSEPVGRAVQELAGQYPLERYGMTELGIVLSNPLHGARWPGCCGAPLPEVRARIVAEDGADAAVDQPGELWIAAPSMFDGYDGEPHPRADFDGDFFKTGDTACWTNDGTVRILGRTSVDIIKSGGYKLSALEMEELLRGHSAVEDVAVVGVPDAEWQQIAVAVVVPKAGRTGEAAELRAWCKQRTASYKVPREFVFRSHLPRNAMGKVNKPALLEDISPARAS